MPLPFDVDCVAEANPGLCADARAALAGLSVQNVQTVDGSFTCKPGEARFALRTDPAKSGPLWRLQLDRGEVRPHLTMRLA